MIDRENLLQRFLRYVKMDTMANPNTDRYPSSDGQYELGRVLVQELTELGLEPIHDEFGIVIATIPGNVPAAPVVAWVTFDKSGFAIIKGTPSGRDFYYIEPFASQKMIVSREIEPLFG